MPDIFQTRDATDLLLSLRTGTMMRLVHRNTGELVIEMPVPKDLKGRSLESLEEWKPFIQKLCEVQTRIYKYGVIQIRDGRVSRREARFVEAFHTICTTGSIERALRFSAEIDVSGETGPKLLEAVRQGGPIEIGFDRADAGHMQVLNVKVPLGPMRARHDVRDFIEQVEQAMAERRSWVKIVVPRAVVREVYPNWAPTNLR